jgi:hypothetical protein
MSRYRAPAVLLALVVGFAFPAIPASSGTEEATLVRIIRTWEFAKPSPDPSGLALLTGTSSLLIVDSEVEEGPHWDNANVWLFKPGTGVRRAFKTTRFSMEPTDVAVSGSGLTLAITDDTADRVFIWRKGRDGRWGSGDDLVNGIQSRNFGSADPTGAAYGAGSLFITDGDNTLSDHRVYRLRPGPNGRFDGVAPQGDDFVTSFDTTPLGITHPTDIVYQSASQHLFLVSANEDIIAEATLRGDLVATYDISDTSIRSAAGLAFARATADASVTHLYVADRGRDNEESPAENDGRLFEFELT